MHALYQRLKELDPTTFEQFCAQLLAQRHPNILIRHVDGSAGDDGIDAFAGNLDTGPIVWQCKAFTSGIGHSQRSQIRTSLNRAIKKVAPRDWILCVPIDLDAKTHRWYERLQRS